MTGKNYHQFMSCGAAFLPAARLEEGLIAGLTLTEHFMLAREEQGFFIDRSEGFQQATGGIQEFSIRGTPVSLIEGLSGGNQQRALLALMRSTLDLLLMEHPTRGLDMESAIWVWSKLKERCRQNTSIIFISSDLEEVLHYSDRILVFFGGQVSEPISASETSVDQLGQLIGGKGF
jgi:simple sugar transport system ATP-binding protein